MMKFPFGSILLFQYLRQESESDKRFNPLWASLFEQG